MIDCAKCQEIQTVKDLPPVLKAGSSGTLFNALFNIFNFMHRSPNLFYNKLNSLINEINKQKITSNIILIIFLGDAHAHLVGFLGSCAAHNQGRKNAYIQVRYRVMRTRMTLIGYGTEYLKKFTQAKLI